jgi:hypothetical protein
MVALLFCLTSCPVLSVTKLKVATRAVNISDTGIIGTVLYGLNLT